MQIPTRLGKDRRALELASAVRYGLAVTGLTHYTTPFPQSCCYGPVDLRLLGHSSSATSLPMTQETAPRPQNPLKWFFSNLGPGLISGAADDDPSGIATYSSAGALLGTGQLWTALITWPLMAGVQMMRAHWDGDRPRTGGGIPSQTS
jgi:hypothetical protein